MIKNALFSFLLLAGIGGLRAEQPTRVVDVYNQFIDRFSDGTPAWKTDIALGMNGLTNLAGPRKIHYDDGLGYYTYQPKRWVELNDYEKFAVQNDPRLPHFLREIADRIRGIAPPPIQETSVNEKSVVVSNSITVLADSVAAKGFNPQPRGVLMREGKQSLAYRFEAADLLSTNHLQLIEVPDQPR